MSRKMVKANLPSGKAQEPLEEAKLPKVLQTNKERSKKKRSITFGKDSNEEGSSQKKYKETLSQPAGGLSHREKLLWLQKRRIVGLWAQCDDCDIWRFLPHVLERHQLPRKWFCRMNPDTSMASCDVPATPLNLRDEEDLIHNEYSAGSVVWARVDGWPWWPAMVDDCPDTEQFYWLDGFSDIPTHYNVVFFDTRDITRAWVSPNNMSPYIDDKNKIERVKGNKKFKDNKKFNVRITSAIKQADDAVKLSLAERLDKYSFIASYKGEICKPRKINKRTYEFYNKKFLKKFNVNADWSFDDSEEEDDDTNKAQKGTDETNNTTLNSIKNNDGVVENDVGDSNKTTITDIEGIAETDITMLDFVSNSDTTIIGTLKLKTPETYDESVNADGTFLKPVTQTQDSFRIGMTSPSSEDFDF